MLERLTKAEHRIQLTLSYSTRGTCDRLHTATTLWSAEPEHLFLAGGYNGAPSGVPSCDEIGHLMIEGHCIRTIHGEENALLNCFNLEKLPGGIATILGTPCYKCAIKLVQKKIAEVEYIGTYGNAQGKEHIEKLFSDSNTQWKVIPVEEALRVAKKAVRFWKRSPGGVFKDFPHLKLSLFL